MIFLVPNGRSAQKAVITPVNSLQGAQLTATDMRGGAAMLIAALAAEGRTVVSNIRQIDRGYQNIERKLRHLGAQIERSNDSSWVLGKKNPGLLKHRTLQKER